MKDGKHNARNMPLDPFQYVGRVRRDANGKAVTLEIFQREDVITVADGDEFVTFTTVVAL